MSWPAGRWITKGEYAAALGLTRKAAEESIWEDEHLLSGRGGKRGMESAGSEAEKGRSAGDGENTGPALEGAKSSAGSKEEIPGEEPSALAAGGTAVEDEPVGVEVARRFSGLEQLALQTEWAAGGEVAEYLHDDAAGGSGGKGAVPGVVA